MCFDDAEGSSCRHEVRPVTRRLVVLTGLVLVAGVLVGRLRPADVPPALPLAGLPTELGDWYGYRAVDFDTSTLDVLGVDDHLHRDYVTADGRQANVYVGYYRSQVQGSSMHSPLNCLPGAGWEFVTAERVPFARGWARRALIRKGTTYLLVMYWYQTAIRVEGDEYRSMLYTMLDSVEYGRNDAALVRVIVPVESPGGSKEAQASRQAAEFSGLLEPQLRRLLFAADVGPGAPAL